MKLLYLLILKDKTFNLQLSVTIKECYCFFIQLEFNVAAKLLKLPAPSTQRCIKVDAKHHCVDGECLLIAITITTITIAPSLALRVISNNFSHFVSHTH